MGDEQIETCVSAHVYQAIEWIRTEEQLDTSTAVERLLERGIGDWKLETAIEQYCNGTISIETAANRAELTYWEFLDILEARGHRDNGSVRDRRDDESIRETSASFATVENR